MSFEVETAYYRELLPELLKKDAGRFVVIRERELLGLFDDGDVAYRAGLDRWGIVPFLLRPVRETEPVARFGFLRAGV